MDYFLFYIFAKLLKMKHYYFVFALFSAVFITPKAESQDSSATVQKSSSAAGLFESDTVFEITLRGKTRDVIYDRQEVSAYHPLELVFNEPGKGEVVIPVNVKTRGHFRKMTANCYYPPL